MSHTQASLRVFLVDDSVQICQRVAERLADNGMQVVGQAQTPQGAIAGILDTNPDVVVLDVQLQDGNGLQVLRAVRPMLARVAFVVFSNNAASAYRERYVREGASCFLDKSNEFNELAPAIRAAARQQAPRP